MTEESVNELIDSKTEKIKEANISLIINDYLDIFSSFDPRSYLEKALSTDFLDECKRAARDKNEALELRILVPKTKRSVKEEWKIKKRLRDHFAHHFLMQENEIGGIKKEGILWTTFGLLLLAGVLFSLLELENTIWGSFLILLEVPSWFLIWEGMAKVFLTAREKTPEYEFYKKMSQAEINFAEY